jgi:hypothetical protein
MSAFPAYPPSQTLTVFNDAVYQSGSGLTKAQGDNLYCQFPSAQGTQSFPMIKSNNPISYTYSSIPSINNQQVGFSLITYNVNPTTAITSNTPTVLCITSLQQEGIYSINWTIQYQTTGSSTISSISSYLTQGLTTPSGGYMVILPNITEAGSFALSGSNNIFSQTGSTVINTYNWGSRTIGLCFNVVYTGSTMNINNNPTSFLYPSGFSYTRIA